MKVVINYKSCSGFTEKYAKMIAEKLDCKAIYYKDFKESDYLENDIIIFGTRIHAGMIDGFKKVRDLCKIHNKQFVLFVTGGTPNKATDVIEQVWTQNLSKEEMDKIPHFYMQAGMNYAKMKFIDRLIMKVVGKMMKSKKDKDDNDIGFEHAITDSYDITDEKYTEPLIKYIKTIK